MSCIGTEKKCKYQWQKGLIASAMVAWVADALVLEGKNEFEDV